MLKKLIVSALVKKIQISDAILIAADTALQENGKLSDKKVSKHKTEVSK